MQEILAPMLTALLGATTFEDAATLTLRRLLDVAGEALAESRHARRGRLLRGMVHLRPDDGYRGLCVLEPGAAAGPGAPAALPSTSAWRWVAQHRAAVAIDVTLGKVRPAAAGAAAVSDPALGGGASAFAFDGKESVERLLERAATHLYVLPLRAPGGGLDGMISLEAECRSAIGQDFIWPACGERLQLLADVAAPHLAALPRAPAPEVAPDDLLPVVGSTMAGIIQMARVFAEQDETLLLSGPTGAGKSRLARWCHERSARRGEPFESLDLMTVPEELQLGELFGWKKGAFSGAAGDHRGAVARAEGGTLFIDEIDKLSLKAQAGLLHMLEERAYRPLGEASGARRVGARFIIGTNQHLREAVRAGRFREDLYYRINVLPLRLPPLDERREEIPRWARYMAERRHRERASQTSDGQATLTPEAEAALGRARWPGNLRQLDNIIRRAYALALIDAGRPPREVRIDARHVEHALRYEGGEAADGGAAGGGAGAEEPASLLDLLRRAAEAFVAEAERRGEGAPLDLDLADALRGYVLGAAVRARGDVEQAFRLLGKESVVSNRNQRKALRRELERAAALARALGRDLDAPLAALLDEDAR